MAAVKISAANLITPVAKKMVQATPRPEGGKPTLTTLDVAAAQKIISDSEINAPRNYYFAMKLKNAVAFMASFDKTPAEQNAGVGGASGDAIVDTGLAGGVSAGMGLHDAALVTAGGTDASGESDEAAGMDVVETPAVKETTNAVTEASACTE